MSTMPIATSEYISPDIAPLIASSSRYIRSIASDLHDAQLALGDAGLAGLVDDLRLHRHARVPGVDGVDDRRVTFLDDIAAQLAGARDLAVVGVELLVQADEAAQLQRLGQGGVDALHCGLHQLDDLGLLRQVGVGHVRDAAQFGPVADRLLVDAHDRRQPLAPLAEHRHVLDPGAELEAILDVVRDVALAVRG